MWLCLWKLDGTDHLPPVAIYHAAVCLVAFMEKPVDVHTSSLDCSSSGDWLFKCATQQSSPVAAHSLQLSTLHLEEGMVVDRCQSRQRDHQDLEIQRMADGKRCPVSESDRSGGRELWQ